MLINVFESMHRTQLTWIKLYSDISEGWYKITSGWLMRPDCKRFLIKKKDLS